jgi:hypothetical protein
VEDETLDDVFNNIKHQTEALGRFAKAGQHAKKLTHLTLDNSANCEIKKYFLDIQQLSDGVIIMTGDIIGRENVLYKSPFESTAMSCTDFYISLNDIFWVRLHQRNLFINVTKYILVVTVTRYKIQK